MPNLQLGSSAASLAVALPLQRMLKVVSALTYQSPLFSSDPPLTCRSSWAGSWSLTPAAGKPLPEPSVGLQEAPAAVGICHLLKASPMAPGFVSSQRVTGNSSASLHENVAADDEKFLQ